MGVLADCAVVGGYFDFVGHHFEDLSECWYRMSSWWVEMVKDGEQQVEYATRLRMMSALRHACARAWSDFAKIVRIRALDVYNTRDSVLFIKMRNCLL